ncbi:MAG TPA: alpha/beta hydrolase, partial [Saprospiraceae bacterium]|nr:alpha/beta hydrolase [Saprospiraceae bacterium]
MVTRYCFWSLLFFWLSVSALKAQSYLCENSLRYEDYVVLKVDTIKDVFYHRSESLGGKFRELKMDIFKPAKDPVTRRPAILLAHGGGFLGGRKESLHKHCMEMASRGYVCATAQYRLIDTLVLNEKDYIEGAMRAVMDIAYAIQFLRSNALAQNDFGIDPELIFVGGFSAGAVAALHVNFLDPNELESQMLSKTTRKEC